MISFLGHAIAGNSGTMEFCSQWHHAPPHWLEVPGIYMVTGATLHKESFFSDRGSLNQLQSLLFSGCEEFEWNLHAWAVFSNHYHFIADSPQNPDSLRPMISKLHMQTAKWVNLRDSIPGRRVWYQFYDTKITFEQSYWPRLKYVHTNPVKHGLVKDSRQYPWCSAAWFFLKAPKAMQRKLRSYKLDRLKVYDDF